MSKLPKITSAEIVALIRKRYPEQAYAVFEQVPNGTGSNQSRWADAVAIGLWPSRGLDAHGFEVKVSRADWLKELANPAKAETVQKYCDYWWIACPPGIVQAGELPSNWGLLETVGVSRLDVRCAAPKLEAKEWGRPFVAALARRSADQYKPAIEQAFRDGRDAAIESAEMATKKADEARARLEATRDEMAPLTAAFTDVLGYGWEANIDSAARLRSVLLALEKPELITRRLLSDVQTYEKMASVLRNQVRAIESKEAR